MAARVTVFIDWQNVYGSARRTFHRPHDPYVDGQVDPVRLATWLTHRNADQELHQVRVYRELPDSTRQPASYGANERQAAAWSASGVTVVRRPLMYPRGWPDMSLPGDRPREKGIDVALAIDFVRLAIEDSYDVGILISGDTDLKPALEAVWDYRGAAGPRAETAAWSRPDAHRPRLALVGRSLWCHWMDHSVYASVQDRFDYS